MSSILPHYCAHYGKLRGTQRKGRYSAVKSSQLSWAGQYKKCVQYDSSLLQKTVGPGPFFINNLFTPIYQILILYLVFLSGKL